MPRDFLEQHFAQQENPTQMGRDLLNLQEPESLGHAALYAIPRIGEDILRKGYEGLQSVPGYLEKAKTEVPGFLNPMNFLGHPIERGKQSLAGLLEAAQTINHLPQTASQYAANRLNLIPQEWANKVPAGVDLTQDIEHYLGNPKNPGDALARGLARNADLLMGANALKSLMPHLTKKGATEKLRRHREMISQRNLGPLDVNPELIEDARQFLPNTSPHRNALEAAHYGDYDTLFNLQSDVGKHSGGYGKSWFSSAAERAHGREGMAARNRLLDAIHQNLQSQGHLDISNLLREGQNDYRRYLNFRKYPKALGIAGAAYAVPKNALVDLIKQLWHA